MESDSEDKYERGKESRGDDDGGNSAELWIDFTDLSNIPAVRLSEKVNAHVYQ